MAGPESEQQLSPGFQDKDGSIGNKGRSWRIGYINTLAFEGDTSNDFETHIEGIEPTQDNTLLWPNTSGTLMSAIDASAFDDFADAVTAAAGKTLLISTNVPITVDPAIPSTVTVKTIRGGSFTVATGITCTMPVPKAGRYKIFTLVGTGVIAFNTSGVLVPEWWGAAGDGVTDDAASIKSAMANASPINFSDATYATSDVLTVLSNQIIYGAGKYKTTIKLIGNPSSFTKLFQGDSISNFEMRDLTIDLDISNNTHSIAAILLNFSSGGTDINIHDLRIPESKNAGIWIDKTTRLSIRDNEISNTVNDTIRTGSGNEVDISRNKLTGLDNLAGEQRAIICGSSNNVTVNNNIIEDVPDGDSGATRFVFDFGGATKVTCTGNVASNCGAIADLEAGSTDISITGNIFGGRTTDVPQNWGIYCINDGAQRITIADNTFTGFYHAIRCEAGDFYTISGNIITSCFGGGITTVNVGGTEADHVIVTGNIVRDCSGAGSAQFSGITVRALTGTVSGNLVRGSLHAYAIVDNSANSNVQFFGNSMGSGVTGIFAGLKAQRNMDMQGSVIWTGTATPEGAATAEPGAIFMRTNGGADTTFYVKETGSGNTGWTAMAGV